MSTLKISEAGSVQFPMVDHAAEIGWEPLTPVEALFRRGDESSSLFRGLLEQKILAFNPWLSADAARAIVETFDALPASIEGNRERLAWLRGEHSWFDEQEKRHRRVQLIDFEHVETNAFHVTWAPKILNVPSPWEVRAIGVPVKPMMVAFGTAAIR